MRKVKIIKEFHDINNYSKVYHIGEVHEFSKDRALHLIELGLVEKVVEKVVETETYSKRSKKEK